MVVNHWDVELLKCRIEKLHLVFEENSDEELFTTYLYYICFIIFYCDDNVWKGQIKVHRILLGNALFEFCWIIRNQNNQTKQSNILWEGQLYASFRNILTWYEFVFYCFKNLEIWFKSIQIFLLPFTILTFNISFY